MYCENLINQASKCTNPVERADLLEEAFMANLGLTITLLRKYCWCKESMDDFLQIAYIAFDKAAKSHNENSSDSILSHYRMWIKNECYNFGLHSGHRTDVQEVVMSTDSINDSNYNKTYEISHSMERRFMDQLLWGRVNAVLTEQNANILAKRFKQEKTLRAIAEEYDISIERVRQRIIHSCKKLSNDPDVKEVALYYHFHTQI